MQGWTQMLAAVKGHNSRDHVAGVVERYFASWASGDLDARAALFAPDACFADPVGAPEMRGIEAIRRFWSFAAAAPFDTRPEVHRTIICGDQALVVFTMHLEAKRGRLGSLEVHEVFELDERGLITALRPFWDAQSVGGPA